MYGRVEKGQGDPVNNLTVGTSFSKNMAVLERGTGSGVQLLHWAKSGLPSWHLAELSK